jgi:hypothetical protein
MDPADHPATSVPNATEHHWGTQLNQAGKGDLEGKDESRYGYSGDLQGANESSYYHSTQLKGDLR